MCKTVIKDIYIAALSLYLGFDLNSWDFFVFRWQKIYQFELLIVQLII